MQIKTLLMNMSTVTISSEERKLKSMRMSGVLQSYDMLDGRVYHNAQIMKSIVADEKKELKNVDINESVTAPLITTKANVVVPEKPKDVASP